MHSRSIEFAKKFGVAVHVRSSFSDTTGSLIVASPESDAPVAGCAVAKSDVRLTVVGVPDKPGNAMRLFAKIAEAKIATDMIVRNIGIDGRADISFTVPETDLPATLDVLNAVSEEIGAEGVDYEENVAKVSAVGSGMEKQGGVAQRMFQAIADKGINISMIATSKIKVSALVSLADAPETLRTVHAAFELDKELAKPNRQDGAASDMKKLCTATLCAEELDVSRLSGMEDILIEGIDLDRSQARITVRSIPDTPGVAATMFQKIADAGILVDMIVQSCGRDGKAAISFTVHRNMLQKTLEITQALAAEWKSPAPLHNPTIAILSVRGTGLRSHTGLAFRMFKTLADGGINVNMVSTSERNTAITVGDADGEKGLELLRQEFAQNMI